MIQVLFVRIQKVINVQEVVTEIIISMAVNVLLLRVEELAVIAILVVSEDLVYEDFIYVVLRVVDHDFMLVFRSTFKVIVRTDAIEVN